MSDQKEPRYYVRSLPSSEWGLVTEAEFAKAERCAGFRPKGFDDGTPCTGGFSGNGIEGHVKYGELSPWEISLTAVPVTMISPEILHISRQLKTQDVRCTSHPIWIVYNKKKIPGDPDYIDDVTYYDGENNEDIGKSKEDFVAWYKRNFEKEFPTSKTPRSRPRWDDDYWPALDDMCCDDVIDYLNIEHGCSILKMHYVIVDEFKAVFLTQEAADAYVKANRHNLHNPYIYVDSAWKNPEIITIQNFLKSLTHDKEEY